MVDGEAGPQRPLRSAAPEWAGPLGSSGAAPEEPPAPTGEPAQAKAPEQREPVRAVPEQVASEQAVPEQVAPGRSEPEQRAPEQREAQAGSEWARPAAGAQEGEAAPTATTPAPDAGAPKPATDSPTVTVAAATAVVPETPAGPRRRVRFAHALRRGPRPGEVAREVRAWSGRPAGRLTLPAVLLLALVLGGAAAGAIAIPMTAGEPVAAPATGGDVTPGPSLSQGQVPLPPTGPAVTGGATTSPGLTPTTGPAGAGRPADVLSNWANLTGSKVGVPWVAMQAYGYAEFVISRTRPNCHLKWTTLAAIGFVESNHGRHNASLGNDGVSSPRILGAVLDGTNNNQRILDTDRGVMDGDLTFDRAVGAMQFLPSTWRQHEVDADNDGLKDVNDIDDAALAAGNYLCQGGRDLDRAQDWWNAILSYNDVQAYAQDVFEAANKYGMDSRT